MAPRLIPLGTTALAALVGVVASSAAGGAVAPKGVVEDCSTASFAEFPRAFTSSRNLRVGPLVMTGAAGNAGWASSYRGNKFPLLVRNGHRVTLELSTRTRRSAGLAYGPLPQGETPLRDTHRVVTFIACPRDKNSGSNADGEPVTFWSGGVMSRSPRCVPLRIWIDAKPSPRRAVIRLGVDRCK